MTILTNKNARTSVLSHELCISTIINSFIPYPFYATFKVNILPTTKKTFKVNKT